MKHSALTPIIVCASENGMTPMVTRKKLYFLERKSSGLKPVYRYWIGYLLSSTTACRHMKLLGFLVEFPSKTDDKLRHATKTFRENYLDDVHIDFQEGMVHFKYFASQSEDSNDGIAILCTHF